MKSLLKHSVIFGLGFLLISTSTSLAFAEGKLSQAEIQQLAQDINDTVMSPYCPGRTLSACPSGQARDLRSQVEEWLRMGYTPEAVKNQLIGMFGSEIRGVPDSDGFGIMAWIVPGLFVLLGVLVILLVIKRMKLTQEDRATVADSQILQSHIEEYQQFEDEIRREVRQRMS